MASVSKCDVCGNIGNHEEFGYVKLYNENRTGSVGKVELTVEVCPDCMFKVKELLAQNGSE